MPKTRGSQGPGTFIRQKGRHGLRPLPSIGWIVEKGRSLRPPPSHRTDFHGSSLAQPDDLLNDPAAPSGEVARSQPGRVLALPAPRPFWFLIKFQWKLKVRLLRSKVESGRPLHPTTFSAYKAPGEVEDSPSAYTTRRGHPFIGVTARTN